MFVDMADERRHGIGATGVAIIQTPALFDWTSRTVGAVLSS